MTNELIPSSFDVSKINEEESAKIKQGIFLKKTLENQYKKLSSEILACMEKYGIYQYKDDNVTISYVSASDTLSLDEERLKEKYPKVYEDCLTIKSKNSSIRINVKKG